MILLERIEHVPVRKKMEPAFRGDIGAALRTADQTT
jgi:hypothetical protein